MYQLKKCLRNSKRINHSNGKGSFFWATHSSSSTCWSRRLDDRCLQIKDSSNPSVKILIYSKLLPWPNRRLLTLFWLGKRITNHCTCFLHVSLSFLFLLQELINFSPPIVFAGPSGTILMFTIMSLKFFPFPRAFFLEVGFLAIHPCPKKWVKVAEGLALPGLAWVVVYPLTWMVVFPTGTRVDLQMKRSSRIVWMNFLGMALTSSKKKKLVDESAVICGLPLESLKQSCWTRGPICTGYVFMERDFLGLRLNHIPRVTTPSELLGEWVFLTMRNHSATWLKIRGLIPDYTNWRCSARIRFFVRSFVERR